MEETERGVVRWRFVAAHAFAAVAASVVLAALIAGFFPSPGSSQLARSVGQDLPWLLVSAATASYGYQRRVRWMAIAGGALTALGVLGPAVVLIALSVLRTPDIEEGAKGPMTLADGEGCHSVLPIRFSGVGRAFAEAPEVGTKLRAGIDSRKTLVWALESAETGERLIVRYFRGGSRNATAFQDFASEFRGGMEESGRMTVERESISTAVRPFTYDLDAVVKNGVAFDTSCRSVEETSGIAGVACLQTVAASHKALAEVRSSLRGESCGRSDS